MFVLVPRYPVKIFSMNMGTPLIDTEKTLPVLDLSLYLKFRKDIEQLNFMHHIYKRNSTILKGSENEKKQEANQILQ